MTKLQIVGGGKMGGALAAGIVAGGWCEPSELRIVEPSEQSRQHLQTLIGGAEITDRPAASLDTLLALKPHLVCEVAAGLDNPSRVLSVAAGVTLKAIESAVGGQVPVIRAMPNTPALVGMGAAAIAGGSSATEADLEWAESILSTSSVVVRVTEPQLSAVTALSGSGPAYVYLLAEALVDAAVAEGLPRPVAEQLAFQTFRGAATMLAESGSDSLALRAAVTTPGGTTASGLAALEQHGVRAALGAAVKAAAAQERALGELS